MKHFWEGFNVKRIRIESGKESAASESCWFSFIIWNALTLNTKASSKLKRWIKLEFYFYSLDYFFQLIVMVLLVSGYGWCNLFAILVYTTPLSFMFLSSLNKIKTAWRPSKRMAENRTNCFKLFQLSAFKNL